MYLPVTPAVYCCKTCLDFTFLVFIGALAVNLLLHKVSRFNFKAKFGSFETETFLFQGASWTGINFFAWVPCNFCFTNLGVKLVC
mmetsp:Transcript_7195/g.11467  ORF Transcript_7195/g.11467 Transcript_7195/m.11467 type:complete len:85 (+) Transcript_7195:2321-2575(+)